MDAFLQNCLYRPSSQSVSYKTAGALPRPSFASRISDTLQQVINGNRTRQGEAGTSHDALPSGAPVSLLLQQIKRDVDNVIVAESFLREADGASRETFCRSLSRILLSATCDPELKSTGNRIGQMMAASFSACPADVQATLVAGVANEIEARLDRWQAIGLGALARAFLQAPGKGELGKLINYAGERWIACRVLLRQAYVKAWQQTPLPDHLACEITPNYLLARDVALLESALTVLSNEEDLQDALNKRLPARPLESMVQLPNLSSATRRYSVVAVDVTASLRWPGLQRNVTDAEDGPSANMAGVRGRSKTLSLMTVGNRRSQPNSLAGEITPFRSLPDLAM
ncbi:TPA: hypothetical protein QEL15_003917 [Stenotrophomonas maltophilia]|nr:hypothetical protein [Stenotrophomonas maltophilia]